MKKEEQVLKVVYGIVKGDSSPVHLPVSLEAICEASGLSLEQVEVCCKTLESHGYSVSSDIDTIPPYYYITKAGITEALNPSIPLYLYAAPSVSVRKRF